MNFCFGQSKFQHPNIKIKVKPKNPKLTISNFNITIKKENDSVWSNYNIEHSDSFLIPLNSYGNYIIKVGCSNYFTQTQSFNVFSNSVLYLNFYLHWMLVEPLRDNIIFFDHKINFNKSDSVSLLKYFEILNEFPKSKLWIEVHTDLLKNKNLKKSLEWAKIVESFYISKGIEKSRIIINGNGNKNPLYPSKNRKLNNRIELIIR